MHDPKNMQIVLVPVDQITPYWRNPRRNDKTVDALVNVILPKHGFNVPIVLDQNYVVVKGHARLKAAKRLGMKTVPCVISDASPEAIKADRIADNAIQEMSLWDMARLEVEWERVKSPEIDRLFHPEEVQKMDVHFAPLDQPSAYQGTSLDDYDEEDEEAGSGDGEEPPCGDAGYPPYDERETQADPDENPAWLPEDDPAHFPASKAGPQQASTGSAQTSSSAPYQNSPQTTRKALKTLCPYCGETVYVRL